MPRRAFSASNGDGVAPCSTEYAQIASSSSRSPAITPSVASLWPAMPLVAECSDEVDTVGQRLLAEWRGERRVDHRERARDRTELVEVDQLEARIRRGLGEHEHRAAGPHGGGERAGLGAVDQRDVDAHARARALQEGERAGVELALGDDVVAGRAQGE